MKTKTIDASITDVDVSKGLLRGYIAIWNTPDSDGDFVVRGKTFKKTLIENGPQGCNSIPFLLNDSRRMPLGSFTRLWEDEVGLAYEVRLSRRRPGVYTTDSETILRRVTTGYQFVHANDIQIISQRPCEGWGNMITEARLFSASLLYIPLSNPCPFPDMLGRPITDVISVLMELRRIVLSRNDWSKEDLDYMWSIHDRLGEVLNERRPLQKVNLR